MKRIIFWLLFFIYAAVNAQDANDDKEYHNSGMAEGITIYGERSEEFASDSIEAFVLDQLNGTSSDRKYFIETEFLEDAGFRRTGNVKYRKTESSEKAMSVLHGITHLLSFGIVPMKPFFEINYEQLPKGRYYSFEAVFAKSKYGGVSQDVWNIMKLEYMLQIEFCNGIIIQDSINYYTDENINKFEELINKLPDYPESVLRAKTRFRDELKRIKRAYDRLIPRQPLIDGEKNAHH